MLFTTNLFVANQLKLSVCLLTGSLPNRSVKRQLYKLVINFFTESLATKATTSGS